MTALARLGGEVTGPKAVLALLLSPYAVFLFAGYSETLFLAFALPAWLLAQQRRWEAATLCAMGATCVRVTGIFLAVALIVEFLVADRRWRLAPWLLTPFVSVAGYTLYQWRRTGDWMAWQHAQQAGWGRSMVWPWKSFADHLGRRLRRPGPVHRGVPGRADRGRPRRRADRLAAVPPPVGRGRRTSGFPMISLLTSAFYLSIGRATLLWWPLWLAVGAARRWAYLGLLVICVPLLVEEILLFTSGAWAG